MAHNKLTPKFMRIRLPPPPKLHLTLVYTRKDARFSIYFKLFGIWCVFILFLGRIRSWWCAWWLATYKSCLWRCLPWQGCSIKYGNDNGRKLNLIYSPARIRELLYLLPVFTSNVQWLIKAYQSMLECAEVLLLAFRWLNHRPIHLWVCDQSLLEFLIALFSIFLLSAMAAIFFRLDFIFSFLRGWIYAKLANFSFCAWEIEDQLSRAWFFCVF